MRPRHASKLFALIIFVAMILPIGFDAHSASAAGLCDSAQFVADVTIPDGTIFNGGTAFTKTWRLRNVGTCTWTTAYALVFSSGEQMGGPSSVNLPYDVAPGQTVDLSVNLVAPVNPANYRGFWKLMNTSGGQFGIGSSATIAFWVDIRVNPAIAIGFDFTENICSALWVYDGGPIPCPFKPSQERYGSVFRLENPTLETGLPAGAPALLTIPQQKYNGIIRGVYPIMDIFPGDHFQATIGCEYGAVSCFVTFQLEYLTNSGEIYTIWKFRERYEGRMYNVDIDLNKIAFKRNIRLVLTVNAYGPATGDRALWVHPILARPVLPQAIPGGSSTSTAAASSPTPNNTCDRATFVTDVSVPDGTTFVPGAGFTKTWRMKNTGTCTWTTGYSLVFSSGEKMSGQDPIALPYSVAPNQTVDISVNLIAPSTVGQYQGFWLLRNASGSAFGIGSGANLPFWVKINVSGTPSTPTGSVYDFVANTCTAQWYSGAGVLPCPGTDGDARGFVLTQGAPRIETGATDSRPGLLTFPQNTSNGYIQGIYPAFTVQTGDHFQAMVNCEYNATDCFILYRLDYQIGSGPIQTFWTFAERYDGLTYNVDLDLSSLAGQSVKFIITTLANGSATGDRALWVAPRIVRTGSAIGGGLEAIVPTSTSVPSEVPSPTVEPPTDTPTPTPLPTETATSTPSP
jgi:hypothetical protein